MISSMSLENVLRIADNGYGHALLSADEPNGRVVREALPVRRLTEDTVEVLGSPGMLLGFAAGDTLKVAADHRFVVTERGPNVCIQAFAAQPVAPNPIGDLRNQLAAFEGLVETPEHRKMIVLTLPATVGTQRVTEILNTWARQASLDGWWFNDAATE